MISVSDRVRLSAVVLVAGLLLAACGDDGGAASDGDATDDVSAEVSPVITVPTGDWRPGDPGGRALLEGRLDMSDPACPVVVAGDDRVRTLVVWPAGTYASEGGDAPALYAEDGTILAQDGDRLRLGGSSTTGADTECASGQDDVFVVEAPIEAGSAEQSDS